MVEIIKSIIVKSLIKCKKKNVRFAKGVRIDSKSNVSDNVFFGRDVKFKMSHIGHHSYVAEKSEISRTMIGNYCSIGPHVIVALGAHPTRKFVSTHPAFYSKSDERILGYSYVNENIFDEYPGYSTETGVKSVIIGNDVWIGANATIIEGTCIGDGVIVGAGAVVKGEVPDYAIVAGNPAKIIRYRFNKEQIEELKNTKWWDCEEKLLLNKAKLFSDVSCYLGDWKDE